MKKIFITYSDNRFEKSKIRLLNQVKNLHIFDKCIGYGPKDLPLSIKLSPLFSFERGAGYWCWKPYIIWETLQMYPGYIVVYLDAGCSVKASKEWDNWFNLMENTDAIVFQYRSDYDYGWEAIFGRMDVSLGSWTKKEMASFFDDSFGETSWRSFPQILGGMIIAKGRSTVVKTWLDLTMLYPHLVVDPLNICAESSDFIQHRHDQSLLAGVVYLFKDIAKEVKIIAETAESDSEAPVLATRINDWIMNPNPRMSTKTKIIHAITYVFGGKLYEIAHSVIFPRR